MSHEAIPNRHGDSAPRRCCLPAHPQTSLRHARCAEPNSRHNSAPFASPKFDRISTCRTTPYAPCPSAPRRSRPLAGTRPAATDRAGLRTEREASGQTADARRRIGAASMTVSASSAARAAVPAMLIPPGSRGPRCEGRHSVKYGTGAGGSRAARPGGICRFEVLFRPPTHALMTVDSGDSRAATPKTAISAHHDTERILVSDASKCDRQMALPGGRAPRARGIPPAPPLLSWPTVAA